MPLLGKSKLAKHQPEEFVEVPINFPKSVPITPSLLGTLVCDAMKHLLYMRQQIPSMYDQIRADAASILESRQNATKPRLLNGANKKLVKFAEGAEIAWKDLQESLQTDGVQKVLLIFGSTPSAPREVYILHINRSCLAEDGEEEHAIAEKDHQLCRRKLVQSFMQTAATVCGKDLAPTKAHMLLQAKRSASVPTGFIPKPKFNLKTKRAGGAVHVYFGQRPAVATQQQEEVGTRGERLGGELAGNIGDEWLDDAEDDPTNDMMWFQHRVKLTGYRLASGPM